jgi:sigma-54 dependent transcriptional regulator, flagellar regulatory protein
VSESRILVIDNNRTRAEHIGTVLDFMGLTPSLHGCVSDLALERRDPQDWLAIVIGDIADELAWHQFLQWLRHDPLHPPILALPVHHYEGGEKFGLNDSNFWRLDYPIKQPQIAKLLRRSSIERLHDAGAADMPRGGPTGSSAPVQQLRRMSIRLPTSIRRC